MQLGKMKRNLLIVFILFSNISLFAQGHIDNIKTQPYLKLNIDCDCEEDSCVSSIRNRFCANLSFQRMDSLLTNSYDSLLNLMREFTSLESEDDSLSVSFIKMQDEWRNYRNIHCKQFWNDPDCNSNYCGTHFLKCMEYISELRLKDLERLIEYYNRQIEGYKESDVPINIE